MDQLLAFYQAHQAEVISGGLFVLETVCRLSKTEKPMSMLYIVAKALVKGGLAAQKLGDLLDKVIPQRIK